MTKKRTKAQRRKQKQELVKLIKRDGGPMLLQKIGSTGYYLFDGHLIYHAPSEKSAIDQYAETIVRISEFLNGERATT